MIEQKLEVDPSHKTDFPQINIVINNFLFFSTTLVTQGDVTDPLSQESAPVSPEAAPRSEAHPHTAKCDQDVKALIPYAKKGWLKEIPANQHLHKIGKKRLAEKLLEKLPSHISLHCEEKKRLPRMLKAVELTDPRIYEKGRCIGLKPHWEAFGWVQ